MILENLLLEFGAQHISLRKGQVLFEEGNQANFYYQISIGEIKMYNITEDGKEFVQGIFQEGKSFGEPPLIGAFNYPASAAATKPTRLLKLPKKKFIEFLKINPESHLIFTNI